MTVVGKRGAPAPNQLVLLSAQLSPDPEMIDRYVGEAVAMFLARYGTP